MRFLALVILCTALVSCAAMSKLVEGGGRLIDGSAWAFKTKQYWRTLDNGSFELRGGITKAGEKKFVFISKSIPYVTFYATEPDAEGNFFITQLHFLAGNYGGWNEYIIDAAGRGRLRVYSETTAALSVSGDIDRSSITEGKIRREGTRLTGERALVELRNRNERVKQLVAWMQSTIDAPVFENQKQFETYWYPKLFPKNVRETAAAPKMPENLELSRKEGALETDWNEASSWIYLEYNWKKLSSVLSNEIILTKVK